ncbi:uncharacterized protein LOC143905646 [Temnothorax americanus]|uniref:uncharacterized protein LOC143905646 n=1 Tax=Temnothorax americanus TaxID=1964332 RepID=UPI00406802A8
MRKLQLLDEESGDIYVLNVTEEDYVCADDLTYRTKLLENAKKNLRESDDTTEKEAVDDSETYNDGFRWVNQAVRLLLAAYKDREDLLIKGKVSVKKFWEIIS